MSERSTQGRAADARPPEAWRQRVGALCGLPALVAQLGVDPADVLAAADLRADALADADSHIACDRFGRLLQAAAELTGHGHFGLIAGRMTRLDDLGVVGDLARNATTLADADSHIACDRFGRLLQAAADMTGHGHFGLIAGRMVRLDDLGVVGNLARNATTLAEALEFMVVHQHLNSEGDLVFVARHEPIVEVGYAIYVPGAAGARQICDYALAALFMTLRELAGQQWLPSEVFLPHARPAHAVHYEHLFRVLPRFDSEFCSLRFPAYWLHRPVPGADPARRGRALEAAREAADADVLQQVYRTLRQLMLSGRSSGNDVAGMLSMNRRTLNRRLRERGTTFQRILDSVRCEVARQLLEHSQLTIEDVAASLGYAGASPFTRSFRRWTASSPGDFRKLARAARPHPASARTSPGALPVRGGPDSDPPSRRYEK